MNTTPNRKLQHPIAGIGLCVLALFAFALQDTLVKRLSETYPVLEVLTIRNTMVFALLIVVGLRVRGRRILETQHPIPMLWRGCLAFLAFSTYYLALTTMQLADAAAVYMTAPLFVTVLSVPLLKERVGWHRWMAVILGFSAVMVMLNPGAQAFEPAAALPLFSALCYAAIPILTRHFGLHEHALTMGLYSILSYLVLCTIAALLIHAFPAPDAAVGPWSALRLHWQWIEPNHLLLSALAGCLFTVGLLAITQAYRIASVSAVAPFEYSYLLWAMVLGYLVFGEVPGTRTLVGGAVVVACGCYVINRERHDASHAATAK